jgi:hypothetical protein
MRKSEHEVLFKTVVQKCVHEVLLYYFPCIYKYAPFSIITTKTYNKIKIEEWLSEFAT